MHELAPQLLDDEVPAERGTALRQRIADSPLVGEGPHIWVGTVDDYLIGSPHGRWIAASSVETIERDIAAMVAHSPTADRDHPAPRAWHIFSHRGFGRYRPTADLSLAELVRRARQIREDARAYGIWAERGHDDPTWLGRFHDAYQGRYDCFADWVLLEIERAGYDHLLDQAVPKFIRPHVEINVESLADELLTSGAAFTARDRESAGVFVFRNIEESLS